MKEIIIGRNGNQPFKISSEGVSAQHAQLTIRDDGKWWLKDLSSKNGTYIFNRETHQFDLIGTKIIDENTLIRLGADDSIRSYKFLASQLVKENQEDFSVEFQNLRQKWTEINNKRESLERQVKRRAFIPAGLSIALISFTCILPESWPVNLRMNITRAVLLVPSLLSPFLNSNNRTRLKLLSEEIKETIVCPNPECGLPLSEIEIKKGQCFKCKKHI